MKNRVLSTTTMIGAVSACVFLSVPAMSIEAVAHECSIRAESEQITGTIVKTDFKSNSFTVQTSEDKTLEFSIDEDTKYFVNDKEATKEEALQRGSMATIHYEGKKATRVNAQSA